MRVEVRVSSPEPAVGVFTPAGTCPGRLRGHCVIQGREVRRAGIKSRVFSVWVDEATGPLSRSGQPFTIFPMPEVPLRTQSATATITYAVTVAAGVLLDGAQDADDGGGVAASGMPMAAQRAGGWRSFVGGGALPTGGVSGLPWGVSAGTVRSVGCGAASPRCLWRSPRGEAAE
jgi:hypothetical protein